MGYIRNDVKLGRCKYCNQVYLINESTLYTHTVLHKKEYESGNLRYYGRDKHYEKKK